MSCFSFFVILLSLTMKEKHQKILFHICTIVLPFFVFQFRRVFFLVPSHNYINLTFTRRIQYTPLKQIKMSFLVSWFWNLLYEWGFFQKKATILLVGLDNAGKTSLLYANNCLTFFFLLIQTIFAP